MTTDTRLATVQSLEAILRQLREPLPPLGKAKARVATAPIPTNPAPSVESTPPAQPTATPPPARVTVSSVAFTPWVDRPSPAPRPVKKEIHTEAPKKLEQSTTSQHEPATATRSIRHLAPRVLTGLGAFGFILAAAVALRSHHRGPQVDLPVAQAPTGASAGNDTPVGRTPADLAGTPLVIAEPPESPEPPRALNLDAQPSPTAATAPLVTIVDQPDTPPIRQASFVKELAPAGHQTRCLVGHENTITSVAFAAEGQVVSGSLDGTLRVWDIEKGQELRRLSGHSAGVHALAVSADGQRVLSGAGTYSMDGNQPVATDCTLRLWDLSTGHELRHCVGHKGPVMAVALSADGRFALSGSHDKTVRLWDLANGQELRRLEGHDSGVHAVAFAPDGRFVLSAGGYDRTVRVWDLESGKEVCCFPGHGSAVTSVLPLTERGAFLSASGSHDARAGTPAPVDCTIRLWDVETGREVLRLDGHTQSVTSLALSQGDKCLVSGSMDGTVRLWDTRTGKPLECLSGHTDGVLSVAVTADGRFAVSGGNDRTVRVWQLSCRSATP